MNSAIIRYSISLLTIFCLLFLTACATTPHKGVDRLEALRATATEYWKLRMADKYEETYKMEHKEALPSYNEYLTSVQLIKKFTIVGHNIKDVRVEGDKGYVDLEFNFILPPVTKPFVQKVSDEWVYVKGKWLHKLPK